MRAKPWDGFRIGRLSIHRKEQWDLSRDGSFVPLICFHWNNPGHSFRLLCIWKWGVLVRLGERRRLLLERRIDTVIRSAGL